MNEMIERVAKNLCDFDLGKDAWDFTGEHDCRDDYRALARVAIKAMREPTEAMINNEFARAYNYGPFGDKEVRRIFTAMIEEALK